MSNRTVSVILPTFNRAALLPRAVDSVVAQTYRDWQLIVVDDGSTDETADIVARYQAEWRDRVVFLSQARAGASAARNAGIDRACGRWIAFLDSDDEFLPQKLQRQVALFDRRPDLGLVFSDMSLSKVDGSWHRSAFETYARTLRDLPTEDLGDDQRVCGPHFVDHLVRCYCIPTITGMIRNDVARDGVRFPLEQSYSEEWLFFLDVARQYRCGFIDEPLSVQHCQPGSVSLSSTSHNLIQQCRALRTIRRRFPDVSKQARRAVCDQLVQCCRQLGFDAYKQNRYRDARRHFTEAWKYRPNMRNTGYVARSLWRQLRRPAQKTRAGEVTQG
ncbi:MAG: glycosyltransferase family 2 protein [Phycisphaerales bacterium]|nr:MAG: glycosyltransferase family 2 protein [Phycisphaerales bacterium]